MFNFVYKWMVENKARSYDLEIVKAINILEKYNLFDSVSAIKDITEAETKDNVKILKRNFFFSQVREGVVVYDIYFNNLHIHVSEGEKEKVYSIRIKRQEDFWAIPFKDDRMDVSHPKNPTYEVYVWYSVPILDLKSVDGYIYNTGSWDKQVYRDMDDFFQMAKSETDYSRFNANYKQKQEKAASLA